MTIYQPMRAIAIAISTFNSIVYTVSRMSSTAIRQATCVFRLKSKSLQDADNVSEL
jgi:hypothetical protein